MTIIVIALAVVLVVAWTGRGLVNRQLVVAFVVPDDYVGYLVTRWECPGGMALEHVPFGGWQDLTVEFDASGTACVANSIPRDGFQVAGFRYGDGTHAPVIVGGTRSLQVQGSRPVGDSEFVISPLASLGIGNGQILGDECTLREFLVEHFRVPERGFSRCEPIYVLPNPALPLTPGAPSAP